MDVEKFFDEYARNYVIQKRYKTLWYKWLVDTILKEIGNKVSRVLDLGSGDGFLAIKLAKKIKNGFIFGIDIASNMVLEARRKQKKERINNIIFWKKRIEDLNRGMKFDAIVANLVIDKIKNKRQLLKRIYKCLKNNGKLVIGLCFKPSKNYLRSITVLRKKNEVMAKKFDDDYLKWKKKFRKKPFIFYSKEHPKSYKIEPLKLKKLMASVGFQKIRIISSYNPEIAVIVGIKSS